MKESQTTDAGQSASDELRCYCEMGGVLDLLSRKYAMQVVCAVGATQPVRYAEMADHLEVSSSTLTNRLTELTEAGVLARKQYAEVPPRVEYELTSAGEELCNVLEPVLEWAHRTDHEVEPSLE